MNVHPSALKHGITPEDATQAASWPIWIEDLDDDSHARQLRLARLGRTAPGLAGRA